MIKNHLALARHFPEIEGYPQPEGGGFPFFKPFKYF